MSDKMKGLMGFSADWLDHASLDIAFAALLCTVIALHHEGGV